MADFDNGFGTDVWCGDNIDSSVDFNLPPVWDLYDDEGTENGDGASPGKIFIGGLAKDTTYDTYNNHFGRYGKIVDSVIMKDRLTGQPRGFGFITFDDPSAVDKVMEDAHAINGKQVEIKRTIPKGSGGGQHKDTWKSKGRIKLQPGHGDGSSSLSGYVFSFDLLFIFDPGGFKLLELRSIPFEGGGDDTVIDNALAKIELQHLRE